MYPVHQLCERIVSECVSIWCGLSLIAPAQAGNQKNRDKPLRLDPAYAGMTFFVHANLKCALNPNQISLQVWRGCNNHATHATIFPTQKSAM
jgi:hypothetical protein